MQKLLYVLVGVALFLMIRYFYFKPSYVYGEQLPDFQIELIDGQDLTKGDLEGHTVLIDFWGSWCGPCRKESPELVKLYDDFKNKKIAGGKFEILGIGIETKDYRWKQAIEKDGLNWPWHYSSFMRFDDPLAKEFGIRQIPTKFLVNEKGMIVAVNPGFDEIRAYLTERINAD